MTEPQQGRRRSQHAAGRRKVRAETWLCSCHGIRREPCPNMVKRWAKAVYENIKGMRANA